MFLFRTWRKIRILAILPTNLLCRCWGHLFSYLVFGGQGERINKETEILGVRCQSLTPYIANDDDLQVDISIDLDRRLLDMRD